MIKVYAKWDGATFHAFSLELGVPVTRDIYATCYDDDEIENAKTILQKFCNDYKLINLTVQLRKNCETVVWQSE